MGSFKLEFKSNQDADFVTLSGTIDYDAGSSLEELSEIIKHPIIRFDFSKVGRINSMGIAFILRCFKKLRDDKGAEISITGLNSMHVMLFNMTGVFLLANQEN